MFSLETCFLSSLAEIHYCVTQLLLSISRRSDSYRTIVPNMSTRHPRTWSPTSSSSSLQNKGYVMVLRHHRYRTRDTSWFYVIIVIEQGIRHGFTSSSLQNKGYVKVLRHHRYRTRDTSWFYVIIVIEQGIRHGFMSSSLQNKGYVKVLRHHRYRTRDTSWFYVIIVTEQGIRQGCQRWLLILCIDWTCRPQHRKHAYSPGDREGQNVQSYCCSFTQLITSRPKPS